jgi:phage regulator Rha-like protein
VGFGLLLTSGLLVLSQLTLASFKEYFSSSQRLQRKQLFSAAHQQQLKQLLLFKTAYIAYFNELRRKRLLAANNRQHIKALSKTIDRHLKTSKLTLPRPTYRQWRQENRRYKHLQDANALLQLQQKIEALEKS